MFCIKLRYPRFIKIFFIKIYKIFKIKSTILIEENYLGTLLYLNLKNHQFSKYYTLDYWSHVHT